MRNNGTQEEFLVNHIVSPYSNDRSFLTDTKKLLDSGFEGEKAVVFYGYDYNEAPLALCRNLAEQKLNFYRFKLFFLW